MNDLSHRLDDLLLGLSDDLRKSVKDLCIIMQNKGIAIGAYTISKQILDILRNEPNSAKAKAKVIQFIKQNKEIKKEET